MIRLRNKCDLAIGHKSEPQQHKDMTTHRLSINWSSGSKKIQFLTSLMTISFMRLRLALSRPASGGGIERVFFAAGKQHDALKQKTVDKTLESTLKAETQIADL
jgi:hypothetical protein